MGAGSSVTVQSDAGCGNVAFSRLSKIIVGSGSTLHIGAGTTLFLIPVMIFTVVLRKHLLRGITFGAVRK